MQYSKPFNMYSNNHNSHLANQQYMKTDTDIFDGQFHQLVAFSPFVTEFPNGEFNDPRKKQLRRYVSEAPLY